MDSDGAGMKSEPYHGDSRCQDLNSRARKRPNDLRSRAYDAPELDASVRNVALRIRCGIGCHPLSPDRGDETIERWNRPLLMIGLPARHLVT
jgi:hypothetical protein